jgi:hypothetical protein
MGQQVDAYLAGDLDAAKYQHFDMGKEVSKADAIGKHLGAPINLGTRH